MVTGRLHGQGHRTRTAAVAAGEVGVRWKDLMAGTVMVVISKIARIVTSLVTAVTAVEDATLRVNTLVRTKIVEAVVTVAVVTAVTDVNGEVQGRCTTRTGQCAETGRNLLDL